MASPGVLGPHDGHLAILGGTGARLIIEGDDAGKRFALVEHPMQPRALALLLTVVSPDWAFEAIRALSTVVGGWLVLNAVVVVALTLRRHETRPRSKESTQGSDVASYR